MLRRGRFVDVVNRQLELFATDEAPLLEEAVMADRAWSHAERERSEELFGEYQLVVDAIAERLLDLRETYASSLDGATADAYRNAFDRAALKRFRPYAALLGDE